MLRPELLRRPRPDGGLDLLDPLLERITALSAAEAAVAEDPPPDLRARLEERLLVEGAAAEALRREAWASRLRPEPPELGESWEFDWAIARALPPLVRPAWRDPDAWAGLAEERCAGRAVLALRGLVEGEWLCKYLMLVEFQRLEAGGVVRAWQAPLPPALASLMADGALRALAGAALGVELSAEIVGNTWRMGPGDGMGVHPDGRRYAATLSVGLSAGWRASQGGAIAFGAPSEEGFEVRERWLPRLGDACLFAPHARSWHAVEVVRGGERLSATGWWLRG